VQRNILLPGKYILGALRRAYLRLDDDAGVGLAVEILADAEAEILATPLMHLETHIWPADC
jgi:hypothetical protein